MTRSCLLHIGAPKTGSTALQKFLCANADRLKSRGWSYPQATLRGYGHHDLAFLVSAGYPDWALPQDKPFDQLQDELAGEVANLQRIVLSSENFYLQARPSDVARMLKQLGFPVGAVQVLVYIRRQDEALVSWYNQKIKAQGYFGDWQDFCKESLALWNYDEVLSGWATVFREDRIAVRPYQAAELVGGDICRDALEVMGVMPGGFEFAPARVNTRINRDILEFQRQVNRLPLTAFEKRRFREQLMALTQATQDSGQFSDAEVIDADERRRLLALFAQANRAVARRFLGRDVLFDETVDAASGCPGPYPGLQPEALAQILGWLMARS